MSYAQVHHDIMSLMFSNLATEYGMRKAISSGTLIELHAFFRAPLKPALKLIDGRRVKRMRSRSGRIAFQVTGEAKISYTCLQESNFCSCYSYLHQGKRTDFFQNRSGPSGVMQSILGTDWPPYLVSLVVCSTDKGNARQVLRKQEIPMCKHVLAARLAVALGKCEEVDCSDDTMIFMLQNLF